MICYYFREIPPLHCICNVNLHCRNNIIISKYGTVVKISTTSKGLFVYRLLLKTKNWKYCSKIIFKCVNSTMRPIFSENFAKKRGLWVLWTVHAFFSLWTRFLATIAVGPTNYGCQSPNVTKFSLISSPSAHLSKNAGNFWFTKKCGVF